MNKRQVIILWIIALVLAGAVTAVKLTQKDTSQSATKRAPGDLLFESFPGADVANLDIQGATGSVSLLKKDGKWTVTQRDAYPANVSYVNDFLRTIGELKITRNMEAGPSFAPRFGMDETSTKAEDRGITATFKDVSSKEIAKVSLGKNIETGGDQSPMGGANAVGRYIRNHADESGFYASSQMFPSVSVEAARWLADGFISPEKIKTITLSQIDKNDPAWKLTRESEEAEFKLENAAPNEVLDAGVSAPLKSLLSYARFEDVVPADKVAERSETSGKRTAIIETFEGFIYTLTVTPAKAGATPPPIDPANPAPPSTDKLLLTVTVTAELPKERKKEENEKPEDAKIKDAAFTERLKTLTEKLEKEKSLAGRTFEIGKTTLDVLLKERETLIAKATPPSAGGASSSAVQQLPGGLIAPRPPSDKSVTTPPIEAVTPAISIPAAEEEKEDAPKEVDK